MFTIFQGATETTGEGVVEVAATEATEEERRAMATSGCGETGGTVTESGGRGADTRDRERTSERPQQVGSPWTVHRAP